MKRCSENVKTRGEFSRKVLRFRQACFQHLDVLLLLPMGVDPAAFLQRMEPVDKPPYSIWTFTVDTKLRYSVGDAVDEVRSLLQRTADIVATSLVASDASIVFLSRGASSAIDQHVDRLYETYLAEQAAGLQALGERVYRCKLARRPESAALLGWLRGAEGLLEALPAEACARVLGLLETQMRSLREVDAVDAVDAVDGGNLWSPAALYL